MSEVILLHENNSVKKEFSRRIFFSKKVDSTIKSRLNNFILPDKKALITLRAGFQAEHGSQISTSCKPELITKQSSWNRKCVAKKYLLSI